MVHEEPQGPDEVNREAVSKPSESAAETPKAGPDLRLNQQIVDALAASPGGEKLDRYFGISSGEPEQSPEEAREAEDLVEKLRQETTSGAGDFSALLGEISKHADSSGADPDALRALMRGARKPSAPEERETEG